MPKATEQSPQQIYGSLLAAVQERRIFIDGKTFVDAVPKRPVADIMTDFYRSSSDDSALLGFVEENFDMPRRAETYVPTKPAPPLRMHIRALWPQLARDPSLGVPNSSALPVNHRHMVPGGRFREIYYWDSYFTMLGLLRDGEIDLATGILDTMTDLIESYGYVPNGARTYYLGRSQPPIFHMMVTLLADKQPDGFARRLAAMKREYAWWMDGVEDLAPGERTKRVARLADGAVLNRYWDPHDTPRDESWREDVETASHTRRPAPEVYRDLRAAAESGWDFSSRWLDGTDLSSIRTTAIAPIDLNSFLYSLECTIAASGDADAAIYAERATQRRHAMHRHLWHADGGYFADFDLDANTIRPAATAATLAPLLVGLASDAQAEATAQYTHVNLFAPGGLRTTIMESGQQWDKPNGWAPLQWIAVMGLRRYGHDDLAKAIANRWIATVDATYVRTGLLFEKYDVENLTPGEGGEYAPQVGFGWTNGVTADLIDRYQEIPSAEISGVVANDDVATYLPLVEQREG